MNDQHPSPVRQPIGVAFFGKCGAGKTSLVNALFGLDWPTDHATACTEELTTQVCWLDGVSGVPASPVKVMDTPGVSEDQLSDNRHLKLYEDVVEEASRIVWVFQADTRVYRPDQVALKHLASALAKRQPRLIVCLNQIDQIGPGGWCNESNTPSEGQRQSIVEKSDDLGTKLGRVLGVSGLVVLPCSAKHRYGLARVKQAILLEEFPDE